MRTNVLLLLILIVTVVGCAGADSHNPTVPTLPSNSLQASIGNRHLWGLWDVYLGADHQTVEVVPMRIAGMHLNAVRLLEVTPCKDCMKIGNIHVVEPNVIEADVTLTHPYPGLLKYTGFDVRGIFISGADYTFPVSGRKIAWGDGVPRMLNPDGYTALFNPTEYPPTEPAALGYIPGKFATGGDLGATLNAFVTYREDAPRRMFEAGGSETKTVRIYVPPGPIHFGYAVDACWVPVAQVIDPLVDFPPEANCLEAYRMDVSISTGLTSEVGSQVPIQIEIYDHQGQGTISSVTMEAPDLFSGDLALTFSYVSPDGAFVFSGTLPNDLGASDGEYPLLVMARDTETDPNPGDVAAWQVLRARVGPLKGWARTWGGTGSDSGLGVAVDNSGNLYVTGWFSGLVDFNPGPGADIHLSDGETGAFLTKFDSGGYYIWAQTWGGTGPVYGRAVAVDGSGNVYVTGYFKYTADFDPGPDVDNYVSNGDYDIFLTKFDSSGNFIWARTWGGPGSDIGLAAAVDGSGKVYVTGEFQGSVDFDPGPDVDSHVSNSWDDTYLTKFDSSGSFIWARTWGGLGADYGYALAVDGSGNVYVTGIFSSTVDFDPGPGVDNHASNGNAGDAFLTKFDSSGSFIWARTWGATGDDYGYGAAVDGWGNVYVTGFFEGTVDFDPGPDMDNQVSNGELDIYLTKFDSSGNFVWTRTWGGKFIDYGAGAVVDGSGNVYATGWFKDTVDFDPGPGADNHVSIGADSFVTKFDSSGGFIWARTWGGSGGFYGYKPAVDGSGNIYVTGGFGDTVDFDPGPGIDIHISNGIGDVYLSKFPPDGNW